MPRIKAVKSLVIIAVNMFWTMENILFKRPVAAVCAGGILYPVVNSGGEQAPPDVFGYRT